MKSFFVLLLSHLLRILFFTVFCFQFQAYTDQRAFLNRLAQQLVGHKPDILYFSDTNHTNSRLLSTYTTIVSHIREIAPEYNCVLLEADKQTFQPAIDDFMNEKKSWKDSVGVAQKQWKKITGGEYDHASKPLLNRMRELGLKVFAVDWPEDSFLASKLREKRLSEDRTSQQEAWELSLNVRNSVMAQNISQLLSAKDQQGGPVCVKALMFVGGLHLAEDVMMPMIGRQKYKSIASQFVLRNYSQEAHEIMDCNDPLIYYTSSKKNREQCSQFKVSGNRSVIIQNLFQPEDFFSVISFVSLSQTAVFRLSTNPKIKYNIMILSKD